MGCEPFDQPIDGGYTETNSGTWANADGTRVIAYFSQCNCYRGCFAVNNIPAEDCFPYNSWAELYQLDRPSENIYHWDGFNFGFSSGITQNCTTTSMNN